MEFEAASCVCGDCYFSLLSLRHLSGSHHGNKNTTLSSKKKSFIIFVCANCAMMSDEAIFYYNSLFYYYYFFFGGEGHTLTHLECTHVTKLAPLVIKHGSLMTENLSKID
jgi:hypothetical protein